VAVKLEDGLKIRERDGWRMMDDGRMMEDQGRILKDEG
jgi:hypothetical protein